MRARMSVLIMSLAAVVGCFMGISTQTATAAETAPNAWLQITPVSQRLDLAPGEQRDLILKVTNVGTEAFGFRVYASPYFMQDVTAEPIFNETEPFTQIASWISFDQTEYGLLEPNVSIEVPYHINVPTDVPNGGQYAAVFAETLKNDEAASSGSIQTIGRVGSLVFANVPGNTRIGGELLSMDQSSFFSEPPISGTALVKNTGNVDFTISYTYKVDNLFGAEIFAETKNSLVLPGLSRELTMGWNEPPLMGLFSVTNRIDFLGETHDQTKLVFIAPIWLTILLVILFIIIIGAIARIIVRAVRSRRSAKTAS